MKNLVTTAQIGLLLTLLKLLFCPLTYAWENSNYQKPSVVGFNYLQESISWGNPFTISFYEPTYILPLAYSTGYSSNYSKHNPNKSELNNLEFDFKLSLKTPLVTHLFHKDNALYLAYTQSSYWQLYQHAPFFRNTDYKPEIFISNHLDLPLISTWKLALLNVGIMHESNGYGDELERSWNRIYIDTVLSNNHWSLSIRPWYIVDDSSLRAHNKDIAHYLGHERTIIAYRHMNNHVLACELYNLEHLTSLSSVKVSWSFPITKKIKGYTQLFHGFGPDLINYNKRKTNISCGIIFRDWL